MIIYVNGRYLPADQAAISPDDRGFLFADGIYEVIRAYAGRFFRQQRHLQRLARSARELRFPKTDFPELPEIIAQVMRLNQLQQADATVYIQVTRGAAPRTHSFPQPPVAPTVYVSAKPFHVPAYANGAKVIIVPDQRWARCDIKTVSLLPNVLAHQHATDAGADEAIFSRNGIILEGTHTNIAIVKAGRLLTPPLTNHILPGITREAALELCSRLNIPFAQQTLLESDLHHADEIMLFATSLEVAPVISLNGTPVANGTCGPITTRLRDAFRKHEGET